MIRFTVYGEAQPAGSKRAFSRPGMRFPVVVDANPKAKVWKEQVSREAARAMNGEALMEGPLVLEATFYRVRPKSHFTGKGARKAGAPTHPTGKPDILKLTRGLEDSMTGIVYRDDAQIVEHRIVRKAWGIRACVEVCVEEVESVGCKPHVSGAAHLARWVESIRLKCRGR